MGADFMATLCLGDRADAAGRLVYPDHHQYRIAPLRLWQFLATTEHLSGYRSSGCQTAMECRTHCMAAR